MNKSLALGILGTGILLLIIIFGPMFSLHDMQHQGTFRMVTGANGATQYLSAPFPHSADYPLGTDSFGRDMVSILLKGARVTILFAVAVALIRVLIALPLAYVGAAYPKMGWLNEKISLAANTIPIVLLVYMVMAVYNLFDAVTIKQNLIATLIITAFAGLFQASGTLQAKMDSIMKYPFMEGLTSIGTGKWRIFRRHIMPHISTHLGILLVTEIAQTLWLLAQLGVIYVFLGGAVIFPGDLDNIPKMRMPEEWAGAIGRGFLNIRYYPLVVLYPLLALTFSMLSFNLLADGIRKWYERKWGFEKI